jgi:hypothetical protein
MDVITGRCQLCNGATTQISDLEYQCLECNYVNHRGK